MSLATASINALAAVPRSVRQKSSSVAEEARTFFVATETRKWRLPPTSIVWLSPAFSVAGCCLSLTSRVAPALKVGLGETRAATSCAFAIETLYCCAARSTFDLATSLLNRRRVCLEIAAFEEPSVRMLEITSCAQTDTAPPAQATAAVKQASRLRRPRLGNEPS